MTSRRSEARRLLGLLRDQYPGRAVEVRVPYVGAVQILPGTTHRRGTPPAVVEMSEETWMRLATGTIRWDDAVAEGLIDASGERADLAQCFPLEG